MENVYLNPIQLNLESYMMTDELSSKIWLINVSSSLGSGLFIREK